MTATDKENDWAEEPHSLFSLAIDDVIRLTTVGIDIGSATSQLSFSALELQRMDTRFVVTKRETIYESVILLTPFSDPTTIDTDRLGEFIDAEYQAAGMTNDDIDSGAIILTGLALAKHNSRAIADLFSAHAGKFVAVSAGDAIEATLASRGAGIEALSREPNRSISHIDMGGGTIKYSWVKDGKLQRVAAIDIGARLIVTDDDGVVLRIEQPAKMMLETLGLKLAEGDKLDKELLDAFVAYEADQVLAHAGVLPSVTPDERLLRTPPLFGANDKPEIDLITFSGGISEYIYDREPRLFNDTGRPLASAVMARVQREGLVVHEPPKGIRATVLGASQYSLQLSGNTVWASSEDLVPVRNVPVANPGLDLSKDDLDYEEIREQIARTLALREAAVDTDAVAIAMSWGGSATYARIDTLSRAFLATAGPEILQEHRVPLIIVCDMDIAGLLGKHIQDLTEGGVPVLTIDGIEVSEFDYLDVGAFVPGTGALPVVVKSLLFPTPTD